METATGDSALVTPADGNGIASKVKAAVQPGRHGQRKRRRGKMKRNRKNAGNLGKTGSRSLNMRLAGRVSTAGLVPYNTNRFLMEDHMPEVEQRASIGRGRQIMHLIRLVILCD